MTAPWPAERIVKRRVDSLAPYPRNARTHSPEQIEQIAHSIEQFGFTMPLLIDEAGGIIAGHARALAAQSLGIAEVPVIVADGWTKSQKRGYIIADNKLTLNSGWDDGLLRGELADLLTDGFDLSLTGFGEGELTDMLREPSFMPVGEDEQGRLDERAPVTCPECGHRFPPP